ncbi:MAG TPA: succinyl-diaminopimelate desuccinylase [Burkholderiaceae bacterium]|nr:succinyl-diaminopimelate desuccinylase [Burkholderiaceae bacterium]
MRATTPACAEQPTTSSPTVTLVKALIARNSVTPNDAGCQDLLAEHLLASGFVAERFDRNGVSNLWLRRGTKRPTFVFAGHTDVVPPGPVQRWRSDPFLPVEHDGCLYGRGAADMKTSIAAFAVAAQEFVAQCPQHAGSIALLLTSDEEGPAVDGTAVVIEALAARSEAIDYCLVGEPTCVQRLGDTIKNGRRGSLSGHLVVRGTQGHVAYPHLARNPIHDIAPALAELATTRWDSGDADFPPTSYQVSNIHAGTGAGNVIPGQCEVDFNLRFAPVSSPESLRAKVEAILRAHRVDYDLQWTLGAQPYQCAAGTLLEVLSAAIRSTVGAQPQRSTTGGTSDGRFVAAICPQVVEFGPTNATVHMVDERVALADIDALKEVYRRTLAGILLQETTPSPGKTQR